MTMILDPREVAQAALDYHAQGKLCAQNRAVTGNFYINDDFPGIRCAIGAGLTEEDAERAIYPIKLWIGLSHLEPEHVTQLQKLQDLHDDWSNGGGTEQAFLDYARGLANA